MSEVNTSIGQRMEILRKEQKMTHEQFAEYIQVSPSQARNYQKGRQPVPMDVIDRLSNGNEILKSWLMCESDFKDLSEIVNQSIRIMNSFSPDEIEFQNILMSLLKRYGHTQLDVGINNYERFISYMDEQLKSSIEIYIKYCERK